MVQPIQYQVPGVSTDPFAGVLQGLRLGATLQELDLARQDRARKEEALRLQQQQQLQQQQYISDFVRRPNKTAQDYTEALLQVPSLKDQFTESWKIENEEQTNKSLSDMGRVFAALSQGKVDTAYADLSQQAADLKAAGAPQQRVDAVSKMAELARTDPEFLKSLTGTRLTAQGDRGKAIVETALKLTAAEQGRMISTPEAKRAAGLVNDKGAPLPGTFFQEPGKEPKLVSGEKPEADTETVRTMRALGYPITEAGFKAYSEQKRAPAVQVSVGAGQKAEDIEFGKYLVDEFKQVSNEANVADKLLSNIAVTKKILNDPKFVTGRGAEFTSAAAGFLSALGVKDARKYAANAEIFGSQANQVTLNKFLEQKGVQTNQDGIRVDNTFALLKNTKDANKFIVAFAESTAQRAKDKRKFFLKYRKETGALDGATEAWETSFEGSKSIFDYPEMKPFRDVKPPPAAPAPAPARPAAAAPATATPAPPPGFGPRAVTGTVMPAESFPVAPQPGVRTQSLQEIFSGTSVAR